MNTFGDRLRECRKAKKLSQTELARILSTNHSVIGKYERNEVKPSIDAVKRIAEELNTTVAYLIGEAQTSELFRDPDMLKRLQQINNLPDRDKDCILYTLDNLLASAATRLAYQ